MARLERPQRRAAVAGLVLIMAATSVAVAQPARAQTDPAGPLLTCPETPILHQVCSVATAVPNLLADGVEGVAGGVLGQLTEWVVAGAKSVVGFVGQSIDSSTRPDVNASWFEPNYQLMVQVGGAFLLPLVLLAALWSLLRHDAAGVVKIVTVKLPVAAVGMVLATYVINLLVDITDHLSGFVGGTIGGSGEKFATGIVHLLEAGVLTGSGGLVGFALFIVALVIAVCALLLWIELVVRQAAVLVGTLFLPVGFAGMVWESTAHWLRKLAEGLLAIILAKFVITAVVAVGANAIAEGGDNPAALILGAGILAVAVFTPYVLLSIIPLGTLALAEGLTRRPLQAGSSTLSTLYWGQALLGGNGDGGPGTAAAIQPATPLRWPTPAVVGGRRGHGRVDAAHGGGAHWAGGRSGGAAAAMPGAVAGAGQAAARRQPGHGRGRVALRRRLRPARRRPRQVAPVAEPTVQTYHFGPRQTVLRHRGDVVVPGGCPRAVRLRGRGADPDDADGHRDGGRAGAAGRGPRRRLRAHRRPPGGGVVLPGAVLARPPGPPEPTLGRRWRRHRPARPPASEVLRRASGPGRGGRRVRSGPRDLSGRDELRRQRLLAGGPGRAGPTAAGLGRRAQRLVRRRRVHPPAAAAGAHPARGRRRHGQVPGAGGGGTRRGGVAGLLCQPAGTGPAPQPAP